MILLVNVVLIWALHARCHSCRHIIGGRLKHFSRHPVRYRVWSQVSKLNARHMQLAWVSLFTVAGRRLLRAAGRAGGIDDLRFFN